MRETRLNEIRRVIRGGKVVTQKELRAALAKAGVDVDQSTLSRDLSELGVRKRDGRYLIPDDRATQPAEINLGAAVVDFQPCGPNLIVVRTAVGQAQPIALAIDDKNEPAVIATLAGDDTIFVATKTQRTQAVVLRRLVTWFGEKRER